MALGRAAPAGPPPVPHGPNHALPTQDGKPLHREQLFVSIKKIPATLQFSQNRFDSKTDLGVIGFEGMVDGMLHRIEKPGQPNARIGVHLDFHNVLARDERGTEYHATNNVQTHTDGGPTIKGEGAVRFVQHGGKGSFILYLHWRIQIAQDGTAAVGDITPTEVGIAGPEC
jgi:hypothetical protein